VPGACVLPTPDGYYAMAASRPQGRTSGLNGPVTRGQTRVQKQAQPATKGNQGPQHDARREQNLQQDELMEEPVTQESTQTVAANDHLYEYPNGNPVLTKAPPRKIVNGQVKELVAPKTLVAPTRSGPCKDNRDST
jgi:hypothetical protein